MLFRSLRGELIPEVAAVAARLGQGAQATAEFFDVLDKAGLLSENETARTFIPNVDSLGPTQVACRSEAVVLNGAMQDDEFLATGAGDRRGTCVGLESTSVGEAGAVVADLGQQTG